MYKIAFVEAVFNRSKRSEVEKVMICALDIKGKPKYRKKIIRIIKELERIDKELEEINGW